MPSFRSARRKAGVLFGLANSFDLRDNDHKRKLAYDNEFLPKIFRYYLATV